MKKKMDPTFLVKVWVTPLPPNVSGSIVAYPLLFAAVPLRYLLTNCGPSYLLSTCFLIVCYCYGVVRAGFLLWRARSKTTLVMIGALLQLNHQFIVWYMSPNIDSSCPQVYAVFRYSPE